MIENERWKGLFLVTWSVHLAVWPENGRRYTNVCSNNILSYYLRGLLQFCQLYPIVLLTAYEISKKSHKSTTFHKN